MLNKIHAFLLYRVKPTDWRGERVNWREEKMDGHRLSIIRTESGIEAFGRKEHIDLWPDLCHVNELNDKVSSLPNNTMLDGELVALNAPATEVVSRMKRRSTELRFTPFAAPMIASKDTRGSTISEIAKFLEIHGFTMPARVELAQGSVSTYASFASSAHMEKIEGYVLKNQHYRGWYKVKPIRTVDAVIESIKPGKGKYTGMIGSLTVTVMDELGDSVIIADVGSGVNDEIRLMPETQLIGRVIEIAYDSIGAGSRLRFPVFMRFRDDKDPSECTIKQLFS